MVDRRGAGKICNTATGVLYVGVFTERSPYIHARFFRVWNIAAWGLLRVSISIHLFFLPISMCPDPLHISYPRLRSPTRLIDTISIVSRVHHSSRPIEAHV